MFSSLFFGGRLGDFLAPRPDPASEIWSFLKGGLYDKVIAELHKTSQSDFNVNELDAVTGLSPLHFAAAAGSMELLVELLSLSADVNIIDAVNGNNALHFAAQNERKGIIEILLRSGADPSIPNNNGLLPVELSRVPEVVELFLRDRFTIFSPIVQTRMLLSDYIKELGGIPVPNAPPSPVPDYSPSPIKAPQQRRQQSAQNEVNTSNDRNDWLTVDTEKITATNSTTRLDSTISTYEESAQFTPIKSINSLITNLDSMRIEIKEDYIPEHTLDSDSTADSPYSSDTAAGIASIKDGYTLVGVSSAKKQQESSDRWAASQSQLHRLFQEANSPSHANGLSDEAQPRNRVTVPKLNLAGPPPSDPGHMGPPPTAPSRPPYGYPPIGFAGGAASTPYRSNLTHISTPAETLMAPSTSHSALLTGGGYTPRDGFEVQLLQQQAAQHLLEEQQQELGRAVLQAAIDTATALHATRQEFDAKKLVVDCCRKFNETTLRRLLQHDPSLATCRITELGSLAADGQTPLHVAARFGNVQALKILLELGSEASSWVRDLQGRTPLHVAAEMGESETCSFLRDHMASERNVNPVGMDAPCDLAGDFVMVNGRRIITRLVGSTPLGRATLSSGRKPSVALQTSLFMPGDRSILPQTPHSLRAGRSPWKGLYPLQQPHYNSSNFGADRDSGNVVYAFSEARGWTPQMEDRVLVSCPVPSQPNWSLFGVCDGHGGSFCSAFLVRRLRELVAKEAAAILSSSNSNSISDDSQGMVLQRLLQQVCVAADLELQQHPRMKVERPRPDRVTCLDSSGSTAVLALVTPRYVAVANVGDSRAVLAQKSSEPGESLLTPFRQPPVPSIVDTQYHSSGMLPAKVSSCCFTAVAMSEDHKPHLPEERARAERANAIVEPVSTRPSEEDDETTVEVSSSSFQVGCSLCPLRLRMSRSFGDFYLKQNEDLPRNEQAVIADPEVVLHTRSSKDAFLVLACDGVWDVMTNQEVVDFLGNKLGFTAYGGPVGGVSTQSAAEACDLLLQEALQRGSQDNLSVVLVLLGPPPPPSASHSACPSARLDDRSSGGSSRSGSINAAILRAMTYDTPCVEEVQIADTYSAAAEQDRPHSIDPSDPVSLPINHDSGLQSHSPSPAPLQMSQQNRGSSSRTLTVTPSALLLDQSAPSPLHTAAGSYGIRKQLVFHDI